MTRLTGEQVGIDYSDTTPDLFYAFNRRGLNTQVPDVTGSRDFVSVHLETSLTASEESGLS